VAPRTKRALLYCRLFLPHSTVIDGEVAVYCESLLEFTVAVIVAVVPAVTVTPNVITALLPLALTVVPDGIFQSIKLAGIVIPLDVATVAVTVPGGVTVVGDTLFMVILLIVPVMTSIGTVALCPPEVAVTVAVPLAPSVGVTVVVDPVVGLIVRIAPVVSEVVQVGETLELLPLTSVPLADICRVPLPLAELRTAVSGVTVMLASEVGETKKLFPPQPVMSNAAKPTVTTVLSIRQPPIIYLLSEIL